MTVASTANKITFPGNGSATNFPFTFSVPPGASTDIGVYFTDALGNITLLASTTYTLTINTPISPNPTSVGGTVTYNPSGVPIPLGTSLTILRTLPETQPDSFVNQGALYPSVVEQSFDAVVMLTQQIQELLGRQITVAVSDPTPLALPPVAQRASLAFMFDSSGNPIAAAPGGANSPVSSAMAPVVNAATIAAAVALLGLTGAAPIPTGMLAPFGGAAPSGWLLAAGQAVSRTGANTALFAYLGTQFGIGDGSTTFNLPDLRGRVPPGLDNMNGIAANRLTSTTIPNGGGPTTLGGNGGTETITLLQGQLPAVAPTFTGTPDTSVAKWGGNVLPQGTGSTTVPAANNMTIGYTPLGTISNLGSGNPTPNVQPSICLNWCIKL